MSADSDRSKKRETAVLFRMSKEEREMLRRQAAERGLSVQVYMQSVMFGKEPAPLRSGPVGGPRRRRASAEQTELDVQLSDQEGELSRTG